MLTNGGDVASETTDELVKDEFNDGDFSLFTDKLGEALRNLPEDIKKLTEAEIIERYNLTPTDWGLRKSFTEAIARAKREKLDHISAASIYKDVCTRPNFEQSILRNPIRVAFMIIPYTNYRKAAEEMFDIGMAKVRDYLRSVKITEQNAAKVLKIIEFCANRSHGPVIQKLAIHQKTEYVADEKDVVDISPQTLLKKLDDVKSKLLKAGVDEQEEITAE
jgi:hypothetical protein